MRSFLTNDSIAISSGPSPAADFWAVIAGFGVGIPTRHLHPENPGNNFPEHQGLSPQLDYAGKRKDSTLSNQLCDSKQHFSGSPG